MFGNMKFFHRGWLRARGPCRDCSTGCFCAPSLLCLLGIQVPLTSCSLEGLSVSQARCQTYRMESHLWILLRTKSFIRDSIWPQENCACTTVLTPASPPAMWRAGRALVTGLASPLALRFLMITLCDQEKGARSK